MNCKEFQTALMSAVERREPVSFAARRHGDTCASANCRRLWSEHLLLEAAVTSWTESVPRVELQDAVLRQMRLAVAPEAVRSQSPNTAKQQPRMSGWLPVASVTAALALLAALFQLPIDSRPRVAEKPPVRVAPKQVAAATSADDTTVAESSSDEVLREVGSKWAGWMEGATARITDTVTYVITPMQAPMDSAPGMEAPADWLKRWGEQLEPLENSLDRTLRQFFDPANAATGEHTG